jgi:hypothetical protein
MIVIKTLTTGQIPTRTNKSTGRGIDPMIVIKTLDYWADTHED